MSRVLSSAEWLAAGSPLAQTITGFRERTAQKELATEVESILTAGGTLVAESGTGTGKTLAYLVPSLLSTGKTIISTGTRHLQDHIFRIDVPRLMDILPVKRDVMHLKGRTNYVCLLKTEITLSQSRLDMEGVRDTIDVTDFSQWLDHTIDGDLATAPGVSHDQRLWRRFTASAEECSAPHCPRFETCFVYRARRRAREADLTISNHHLLLSDIALREEGSGALLPEYDAVIFDEAHQLVELAPLAASKSVSRAMMASLIRDITEAESREHSAADLAGALSNLEIMFPQLNAMSFGRIAAAQIRNQKSVWETIEAFRSSMDALMTTLDLAADAGPELTACRDRCGVLCERLSDIFERDNIDKLGWCDFDSSQGFAFHSTPVDAADVFNTLWSGGLRSAVFLSATLGIKDDFSWFCESLGLDEPVTTSWPSPFDFANHALLYLPPGMPDPSADDFATRMTDAIIPVIEKAGGRTFVLFTSHRRLQEVSTLMASRTTIDLWVQGHRPKLSLLEKFKTNGGVLMGTTSFWEGVDVPGAALSCVIIDKLPFNAPSDPLYSARMEKISRNGGRPFTDYQVPRAVLSLKQGTGRLIRNEQDRGILMICDPRIRTKSYGRKFLDGLPPFPVTDDIETVLKFPLEPI